MASKLSLFFAELKRRKVYRVAAVYAAVGSSIVVGAHFLLVELFERDVLAVKIVLALIILGFPIALVLAWAYEVRPEEPRPQEPAAGPIQGGDRRSILVLPFDNMSPDPGDVYFSDGLTEEIITDLSFLKSLRVISRSSAMALKGTLKDLRTLGRELEVGYVLEGSVRKAGNDLRITAQLIDAESDAHVWAEKYHGTLHDVFGIQEEVSRAIVKALELTLNPEEEERLSESPIGDAKAYDCFLRAVFEYRVGTEEGMEKAVGHLEEGLEIVGENALLYTGLAYVHFFMVDALARPVHPTLDEAEQLAWKALKLDPLSPRSHNLLGLIERHRGTATAAIRHFEQARRIDPNDSEALLWLGWMYPLFLGKTEPGRTAAQRLAKVDPLNPMRFVPFTWVDWMAGDYGAALGHLEDSLKDCPEFRWPLFFRAQLLGRMGEVDQSLKVIDEAVRDKPSDFVSTLSLLFRSALEGNDMAFSEQLTEPLKDTLWNDPECPFWMAGWTALLSRDDEAADWLERAIDRGWINYPLLAQNDPFLEHVRANPRFTRLMQRIEPAWESFEV